MHDTAQEYEQVIRLCRDTFDKKMKDYGTAWRVMRPTSLTDQIYIKANRVRTLEQKGHALVPEGVIPEYNGIIN